MDYVVQPSKASRKAMLSFARTLTLEQLNHTPPGFNNNIGWNLGHIVAVQQLLPYGLCKLPFVVDEFIINNFRAKTKPESPYTQDQIDTILGYFETTNDIMEQDYMAGKFINPTPFISKSTNATYESIESIIVFNLFHEGLHAGVIQKYAQIISKL
jgi:hypothetical protein